VTRFRPHPAQLRALEAMERGDGRVLLVGGQRTGRRYATELAIIAQAASPEEAKLCLEDLQQHGIALQSSDGKRVEPRTGRGRFQYVKFDEEEKKR